MPEPSQWWIATNPKRLGGTRMFGPFCTDQAAQEVRAYVEKTEKRADLWIVSGEDVPDA